MKGIRRLSIYILIATTFIALSSCGASKDCNCPGWSSTQNISAE